MNLLEVRIWILHVIVSLLTNPLVDELDDISARDIAMARYKRNHDYLSEIFTPYNACNYKHTLFYYKHVLLTLVFVASILSPPLDISQSKQELEQQIVSDEFTLKRERKRQLIIKGWFF